VATIVQVVYCYNDDPNTEEPLFGDNNEIRIPNEGDVIERKGKSWKVTKIDKILSVGVPKPPDVYRIFLAEAEH